MVKYISLFVYLTLITSLSAQSKSDLKKKVSELETEVLKLKKDKNSLQDALLKQKVLNKRLKSSQIVLSDSVFSLSKKLSVQKAEENNRNLVEDSVLLFFVEQRSLFYQNGLLSDEAKERSDMVKEDLFDKQSCTQCLKFQTFQSLFTEVAFVEYELFTSSKIFKGFYKYKYRPEFGRMLFIVVSISGKYVEDQSIRTLNITEIENDKVNLIVKHNLVKPRKSNIAGSGLHLQKLYTKEVPLTKMEMVECY